MLIMTISLIMCSLLQAADSNEQAPLNQLFSAYNSFPDYRLNDDDLPSPQQEFLSDQTSNDQVDNPCADLCLLSGATELF